MLGASTWRALLIAGMGGHLGCAAAQGWSLQPSAQASLTASTNANRAAPGQEEADLVVSFKPLLQLTGQGPGLKASVRAGLDVTESARNSQKSQLVPSLRGDLKLDLAGKWLSLETSVDVRRVEADPFAARNDGLVSTPGGLSRSLRLSPSITRQVTPWLEFVARQDEEYAQSGAQPSTEQHSSKTELRLQSKANPWGGAVSLKRQELRFAGAGDGKWALEALRVKLDRTIDHDLVAGFIVGQERGQYVLSSPIDGVAGVHAQWRPTERSVLQAEVEHRFFGTGWDLDVRHRTPSLSMALRWKREPVTSASSLGISGPGSDLSQFLDAILTTRIPDSAARATLVNQIITSRGLSTQVLGALDVRAEYAQLNQSLNLSLMWLGQRNSVTFAAYQHNTHQLTRSGERLSSVLAPAADNRQRGLTLGLNRRLTPQLSADVSLNLNQIQGVASLSSSSSQERSVRVSAISHFSSRSNVTASLAANTFSSSATGVTSYRAVSGLLALNHRF